MEAAFRKCTTVQKMRFSVKDFFSKCDQIRSILWMLQLLNEEILNGKLHFLWSVPTVQPIHISKQIAQETFLILKFYG